MALSRPVSSEPADTAVPRAPAELDRREAHEDDAGLDDLPALNVWVFATALVTTALLVAVSNRYGYHRDELYFLEAGKHLAWGFPDLPPLVPVTARLLSAMAPNSLILLRLPSALAAGGVIVLTGLLVRELRGGRSAQLLAAVVVAASGLLLGTEHYLNTSGFELLFGTLLLWLFVRLLRTHERPLWIAIGVTTAFGLLNSDLVFILVASIVVAIVAAGPRRLVLSPWALTAGLIAALAWTPYLIWQAHHGWPELAVSRAIAAGRSGTSTPRALLLPSQLVLVSPYLAPVWITGLIRLFRDRSLAWCRVLGWAYVLLVIVFVISGGKSYYLGGALPLLVAVGAQPTVNWLHRGRTGVRQLLLGIALFLTIPSTILFTLPVVPLAQLHSTGIAALNYDEGETVGWPTYVRQVARAYRAIPADQRGGAAILTGNYGEAGAIDRFGPSFGLPNAFSGQDGYWYWGPPPRADQSVVAVGLKASESSGIFAHCRTVGQLNNGVGLDNEEQGMPIRICSGLRSSWARVWPTLRES